ncbi:MAG TPA: (4Fe-4S)-binding protein [Syntrophomonadaceae bacterium]|nr:(4Fe-4S)-binding protein [Syntrophomonadaceae bacterium]
MENNQDHTNQARLADDVVKEYRTDDLIVYWNAKLCAHPGFCWRGLPRVFKPQERPWVDMRAASAEQIIKTVDTCPTGALRYELPEGSKVDPQTAQGPGWVNYKKGEPSLAKIRVIKNGPLLIEGLSQIFNSQGKLIKEYHQFMLCRCGMSNNKPFCDGAHVSKGWKAE